MPINHPAAPGFVAPPAPLWLRIPNAALDHPSVRFRRLTPEQLTRYASKQAGLPPRFSAYVEEGLERLCRALSDEANLHWLGRENLWSMAGTGLAALLQIDEAFRQRPELEQVKLNRPLIVTGPLRSGTTFLHRLLCEVDDARPICLDEHLYPVSGRVPHLRRLRTWAKFLPWHAASNRFQLDAIHYVRPGLADECQMSLRQSMRSCIFWAMAPIPSYMQWLLEQDLEPSYQLYRRTLQFLQAQVPTARLTLKCPQHLAWLPTLTAALPEAHIVQTHRDPKQTLPSECKLQLSMHAMATDRLDIEKLVRYTGYRARILAERAVDFADHREGQRVLHVDYTDIVGRPIELALHIRRHFGLEVTSSVEQRMTRYANGNRQHKHGKNRYTLEDFGLRADQVDADFGRYRKRFLDGHPFAMTSASPNGDLRTGSH